MPGNGGKQAWFRFRWEGASGARHTEGAGLWLITRVRQAGRTWILWLRFELYVNLAEKALLEE